MMWPNFIPLDLLKVDGQKHEQIRNHIPTCWFNSYFAMVVSAEKHKKNKQTWTPGHPLGHHLKKTRYKRRTAFVPICWLKISYNWMCLMFDATCKNHVGYIFFEHLPSWKCTNVPPKKNGPSQKKTSSAKHRYSGDMSAFGEVPLAGKYGLCISAFLAPNGFRYLKWRNPHPFSCNKCNNIFYELCMVRIHGNVWHSISLIQIMASQPTPAWYPGTPMTNKALVKGLFKNLSCSLNKPLFFGRTFLMGVHPPHPAPTKTSTPTAL